MVTESKKVNKKVADDFKLAYPSGDIDKIVAEMKEAEVQKLLLFLIGQVGDMAAQIAEMKKK